jgi:ubiquinone/menaquinone biosynthesis C-methylase UbiE
MPDQVERSVCFNRAAEYYDQTRALPAAGRDRVLELLLAELSGAGLCLDVGCGTARTALPLADAGVPVVGVDLSVPMMRQVAAKRGGRSPFPLLAGDVTALPFRDGCFGAATIIHVLRSVPRWRRAIGETIRVVRAGGTVIVDTGDGPAGILDAIEGMFIAELPDRPRPTPWTLGMIDEAFARHGCHIRRLPEVRLEFAREPSVFLTQLERGQASWQWSLDPSAFGPAAQRVRAWAEAEFGALDQPRSLSTSVCMHAYTVTR